ncbi:Protein-L-isoaspartate O-methyltransferase [Penaeus vannamei]|uniref:Protein-L-isoaspartate O-methyltransferase n=1 Tax=Penaeus vannamei TaxID=6689 RepID=A0A3R7P418_PENVA|nr:Protein-L-isoaspartate O-methyltransferase [Penaeus vannamei]
MRPPTALDSLPSGTSRDLQESIRDVLGQGGLRQDSGARVHEGNVYSSDQHNENSSENQAPSGLTCAVCRSTYNAHDRRPLIFSSCGHTFCEECLRTENRKSVFQCPSCRQDRDQFRTLKPNFALLDLLEAVRLDGKKLRLEKEEAEGERKTCFWLEEEEELQLAMAMSLSLQTSE